MKQSNGVTFTILPAAGKDVPAILDLVKKLAEYERLSDQAVASESDFHDALFGPRPSVEALLAFVDGKAVGVALFFQTFSTFLGRPGMYLEDIFVEPEYRGHGIGRALLATLAKIAKIREYGRIEWSVLDWNTPAIGFYEKLGAVVMKDWRICRMTGAAIERMAEADGGEAFRDARK